MKTIVYLHGFISSPQSKKAVMLGDYLRNCVTGVDYRVPALHHRVDEMGSADHHAIHAGAQVDGSRQRLDGGDDAAGHIGGGRRLDPVHHLAVADQHDVRVGTADVDADALHDVNTDLKSMS